MGSSERFTSKQDYINEDMAENLLIMLPLFKS